MRASYAIGPFILDVETRALLFNHAPLPLGKRAIAVLLILVERSGRLVMKAELMEQAWKGLAVKDGNLTVQIAALRRVLADTPGGNRWIETLPRRGYRFAGPVSGATSAAPEPAVAVRKERPVDSAPTLAVLPFRIVDAGSVPTYLANGMAEEIACILAGLREVTVLSCGSRLGLSRTAVDPRIAGRKLGVRYVVTGAMRRRGGRMRVIAELTDARTGGILWSRSFDGEDNLLFDVQDSIVAQVAHTLAPRINEAELRRVRAKRPGDMAAYELVLQAREQLYRLERSAFSQAEVLLQRAITLDPGYAATYALAAEWYSLRVGQGWSPDPAGDARWVNRYATAALLRDGANARALAFLGHNKSYLYRDYDTALDLLDQALQAGPNNVATWGWSSPTQSYLDNGDAAVKQAERALKLSPFDPFAFQYQHFLSVGHYTNGSYRDAARWGLRAMQAQPAYTSNLRFTAASLIALGRIQEARDIGARVMMIEPAFRVREFVERHPYRDAAHRIRIGEQLMAAGLPE